MRFIAARAAALLGTVAVLSAAGDCTPVPDPLRPAGDTVLLVSDRSGAPRLYDSAPGEPAARSIAALAVTTGRIHDCAPARLPDGRIVFVSDRDGNPELYLAAADGTRVTRLTTDPPGSPAVDAAPAALGNDAIVFARGEPGDPDGFPADLHLLVLDGSAPRRLTRHAADDRTPAGSPDGHAVLFVSDREGDPALYRLPDARGADPEAGVERLAAGAGDPIVLPDGSFIVTRPTPGGSSHLFHAAPGGGWRQITDPAILPYGAGEAVALRDAQILFTTGPVAPARGAGGPPHFAVYRIALGGFNLSRVTREKSVYSDFARGLTVCRD